MERYVAIIGGANVDIRGCPIGRLIERDSNIGTITRSAGGVGLNIARNISLLGEQVVMLTALGCDGDSTIIEGVCKNSGIDITRAVRGERTATYLYIEDELGDMRLAINDMGVCELIDRAYVARYAEVIKKAAAVVIDANIDSKTIAYAALLSKGPVFVDTVSAEKALRVRDALQFGIHLKPNILEAGALCDREICDKDGAVAAAKEIIEKGASDVCISMGASGALFCSRDECEFLDVQPCNIVNATGAGDCMSAALVVSYLHGMSARERLKFAQTAAAICMESPMSVNESLSFEGVLRRALHE